MTSNNTWITNEDEDVMSVINDFSRTFTILNEYDKNEELRDYLKEPLLNLSRKITMLYWEDKNENIN